MVAMDELAQVLRRDLRRAVDVARHRAHALRDPCCGVARHRHERPAERARRAREHERPDARRDGLLEQRQRAGDVRVHEVVARV